MTVTASGSKVSLYVQRLEQIVNLEKNWFQRAHYWFDPNSKTDQAELNAGVVKQNSLLWKTHLVSKSDTSFVYRIVVEN